MTLLSERLMIEALADRLAGEPPRFSAEYFAEPWLTCWLVLDAFSSGLTPHEMSQGLSRALENHPDRGEILGRIFAAPVNHRRPHESMDELGQRLPSLKWLWPDVLPRGFLTLFGAAPGSGKSFVSLDLAWRVTNGQAWPDGSPMIRPGANVIFVDAEAVPQIHHQRALNYGMDLHKLFMLLPDKGEMVDLADEKYRWKLVEMVLDLEPELIIIDSLSTIHSKGQNNVEDVRGLLNFLTQLVEMADCGLILVHHIRKPGGGQQMEMFKPNLADLSGSGHVTAMARAVWGLHVVQTGPEPDPTGPRHMEVLKNTIGSPGKKFGFNFVPAPHFEGEVVIKWTDAPKPYGKKNREDDSTGNPCADWLLELLSDAEEPMRPADVIALAQEEGFSRATVYRARAVLGNVITDTNNGKPPNNRWALK